MESDVRDILTVRIFIWFDSLRLTHWRRVILELLPAHREA
jgi:hypothetical protein